MIKILLYGVMPENNFGGPSLMHGAREIIKEIHGNYEIVFYQATKPVRIAICDMGFDVFQIPYKRVYSLVFDAIKFKFGIKPKDKEKQKFLFQIKNADIVANLFGINYASNFNKGKYSYIKSVKMTIGKYNINFIAKIFGIKSVKCTSSYGPIISKTDIISAKYSAKKLFDVMIAREQESKHQLEKVTRDNIMVSPDIANFMPYIKIDDNNKKIGISVSYQIIKQWKSQESYIKCIVELINYINLTLKKDVILIPNEFTNDNKYNDINVANEIKELSAKNSCEVLDAANMCSSEIKNYIACCEVIIASRYHSCVASLSSGVPTFVIGWHYKYDELLELYNQKQWIISSDNCTCEKLILLFNEFWENRDKNRQLIEKCYPSVRQSLINAGKIMFSK